MSPDQNAGRSHNIMIDNINFERVEHFKYLGKVLTDKNFIHEEIKSRLKSGNACSHSMKNILSSSLLSKVYKVKIYKNALLHIVLCGCENRSPTLREKRRLRVFVSRMLRRIFGPKRDKITWKWRKLYNEELN